MLKEEAPLPCSLATHPLRLIVADQLVDGCRFGDLQEDGFSRRIRASGHMAQGAG